MFSDKILNQLVAKYPPPTFQDRSEFLYEDLIESIISQQLSIKAADTIFKRFKELFVHRHSEHIGELLKNVIARSKSRLNREKTTKQSQNIVISNKRGSARINSKDTQRSTTPDVQPSNTSGVYAFPTPQEVLTMPEETLRTAGISFQKISYIKSVADAFISNLIDTQKIKQMSDEEVIAALTQIRGVGKWTAEMILIFTLKRPDIFSIGDLGIRNAITKLYGITDQKKMLELSEQWKPHRSTACWYLWRSLENKP